MREHTVVASLVWASHSESEAHDGLRLNYLLEQELVAGEGENHQALWAVFLFQLLLMSEQLDMSISQACSGNLEFSVVLSCETT